MYPLYMYILLYVNLFGVTVFHRSIVNWRMGVHVSSVYVHSAIVKLMRCNSIPYTYCQLEWGYIYPRYMCILLYMKLIWCNGIPHIYCQLGGRCMLSICAFCSM